MVYNPRNHSHWCHSEEALRCCHSERVSQRPEQSEGEESHAAQGKLRDRRISETLRFAQGDIGSG